MSLYASASLFYRTIHHLLSAFHYCLDPSPSLPPPLCLSVCLSRSLIYWLLMIHIAKPLHTVWRVLFQVHRFAATGLLSIGFSCAGEGIEMYPLHAVSRPRNVFHIGVGGCVQVKSLASVRCHACRRRGLGCGVRVLAYHQAWHVLRCVVLADHQTWYMLPGLCQLCCRCSCSRPTHCVVGSFSEFDLRVRLAVSSFLDKQPTPKTTPEGLRLSGFPVQLRGFPLECSAQLVLTSLVCL